MVLVQLWQPVVFCESFRTCSGDTMWLAFYVRQSGSPPDAKTDGRSAFLESSLLFDDLLQNREFPGLQGTYPPLQEKPYANVLLGAVENLNRIIGRRAIDRAAAILLQELKERLTPGMVEEREDFLPDSLHFVAVDRLDGLLNRGASRVGDTCDVEVFWFHDGWIFVLSLQNLGRFGDQAKSSRGWSKPLS